MRLLWLAVTMISLLSTHAAGYSELIIDENFSIDPYAASHGVECSGIAEAYLVETLRLPAEQSAEFSTALKKIQEAKVYLGSAKVAAGLQRNWLLRLIPGMYNNIGSQCASYGVRATRTGVSANREIAGKIDAKLQELDFEIGGEDFNGAGIKELTEAREAKQGKGSASAPIKEINQAVQETIDAQPSASAATAAGQSASLLISNSGPGEKLAEFYFNLTSALGELQQEESGLTSQASERGTEINEKIDELRAKGANNLGLVEVEKIREHLGQAQGIEGEETQGQSIAELTGEAEQLAKKADAIAKTARENSRGRTARRIKSLRKALQTMEKADAAANRAGKALEEMKNELEIRAVEQRQKAREGIAGAVDPTRKKMAEAVLEAPTPAAANDGQRLVNLATEIKRAELANNLATEKTATLKQRVETKSRAEELEKKANAAQRDSVEVGELASQFGEISKTLEQPLTQEELLVVQNNLDELEAELAGKIEEKFSYLREEFATAEELAGKAGEGDEDNSLKLASLRRIFAHRTLLNAAGQLGEVEKTIYSIAQSAEKAIAQQAAKQTAENKTQQVNKTTEIQNSKASNQTTSTLYFGEPSGDFLKTEISDALKEFYAATEDGNKAFYSENSRFKTLAEISFGNAVKKGQKIANQLEKFKLKALEGEEAQHASELAGNMRDASGAMQSAISDVESQASLEIALASERAGEGSEAQKQVAKAQELNNAGKYSQALEMARLVNKNITAAQAGGQPSQATALATGSTDYRQWAVAASVAIILIGAAYLFLRKKANTELEI